MRKASTRTEPQRSLRLRAVKVAISLSIFSARYNFQYCLSKNKNREGETFRQYFRRPANNNQEPRKYADDSSPELSCKTRPIRMTMNFRGRLCNKKLDTPERKTEIRKRLYVACLNIIILVEEPNIPWPLPISSHKIRISWRPFIF